MWSPQLRRELEQLMSLARHWRGQGKTQQARELLAPVYGWFTEGFDTRDLKEAKAAVAGVGLAADATVVIPRRCGESLCCGSHLIAESTCSLGAECSTTSKLVTKRLHPANRPSEEACEQASSRYAPLLVHSRLGNAKHSLRLSPSVLLPARCLLPIFSPARMLFS
jgi:hypothetical protein